jgi:glycosyltransferase involved in cell wall biosynthesis
MFGQGEVDVAIMLHDLAETGVARNALAIAGAAHHEGLRTEIWVIDGAGPLIEQIPHGVGLVTLGGLGSKWKNRRLAGIATMGNLARAYRKRRPRVALSAGNHFHITASAAYLIAGSPNSVRLLFRASNPPFRGRDIRIGAVLAWLYRLRFRGARRIISVSAELGDILVKTIRLDPSRVVIIANSIDLEAAAERAAEAPEHPWFAAGEPPVILGIGRLAPQKNFTLLIKAFAQVRQARPARLVIIGAGAGEEPAKLQALAARLGLTSADIWFAGHQSNPLKFMTHAELFVLSSNWEGMSNVLLEAMVCGCPIVATDCPTGVRELLEGGRIGAIVPVGNVDAMAQAIITKLSELPNHELLRREAARYDRRQAMDRYVAILREEMAQAKPLEE